MSWRKAVIEVALGHRKADLVITNGQLINVNTREVYAAGVAVADGRIAVVGDVDYTIGPSTQVVDAQGHYLVPGLIESHMHTESSCVTLTELSRVLLPRGVTTVLYAHEMANVLGLQGMELIRQESQQVPLKVHFQTPTSVPWARGLEMPATTLSVDDVREMLSWEESATLGESDYFDVVTLDEATLAKLDAAHRAGKPINGHIGAAPTRELMATIAGAFHDDHESVTPDELLTKLRLGMKIILREANVPDLAPAFTGTDIDTRNVMLCIDDKLINTLLYEGGVDNTLRVAIASGIDPMAAIQMATVNAAAHFRLDLDVGSISPGRIADVVITDSLETLKPTAVVANGELVARNGEFLLELSAYHYPDWAKDTVHMRGQMTAADFALPVDIEEGEITLNVLQITNFGFKKVLKPQTFAVRGGEVVIDTSGPYNWIAVVERHGGDGQIALGVAEGDLNVTAGAIGSSVGHDCHNITVLGTNPADMAACVNAITATHGGFAAVSDGEILAQVPLEIAGLVSQAPYETVVAQLDQFEEVIQTQLGFPEISFIVFNFIVLQSSPFTAAITDRGLTDTYARRIEPLIISTQSA